MSIKAEIFGGSDGERMDIIKENGWSGPPVFTEPLRKGVAAGKPFLNSTFGVNMNQNVAFSGTPELIFDGGSGGTEWSGSGPSVWNFADSGKVSLTLGNDNDEALFEDAGTIDTSAYTALTGKVDLDTYTPATQDVVFQFGLAGVALGDPVSMNDVIDTSNFSEQSFAIPIGDFNLAGATVDEFTMTVNRSGGGRPNISFDDFQIEETGTPADFIITPDKGTQYYLNEITFSIADVGTAGTANAYNKIGALSRLPIGVSVQVQVGSTVFFSATFNQLSDWLDGGFVQANLVDDGTNTYMSLILNIAEARPIILDSRLGDKMTISINDNLSGLLLFKAFARGWSEKVI